MRDRTNGDDRSAWERTTGTLWRDSADLYRPVPPPAWWVPAGVQLEPGPYGPSLVPVTGTPRWIEPIGRRNERALLEQFLRLATATDQGIVAFAERWGLLGLCEHGLRVLDCGRCGWPGVGPEPTEGWRGYAREGSALVRVAMKARSDEPVSRRDWDAVRDSHLGLPPAPPPASGGDVWPAKFLNLFDANPDDDARLAVLLNRWIRLGEIEIGVVWHGSSPSMRLTASPLDCFAYLALQLVGAAVGSPGIFFCDACAMPHFRERVPKSGQGAFCKQPECQAESKNRTRRGRKDNE